MERKKYNRLSEIAAETMPGDLIRHSSWPTGVAFACSTEFLKAYGDYPYADRAVSYTPGMRDIGKNGHWTHAGNYPPRLNTVERKPIRIGSVPHHVPNIKPVRT